MNFAIYQPLYNDFIYLNLFLLSLWAIDLTLLSFIQGYTVVCIGCVYILVYIAELLNVKICNVASLA